ncbi:MAG: CRTAC1 family protein [Deltaproteobacteria bacterium]|nr:CRTAC1 family protein [Deltaproteobacteria bacterium]
MEPPPGDLQLPMGARLGDEVVCAAPLDGPNRLVEEGAARGLGVLAPDGVLPPPPVTGVVTASDLDGDGDVDLLVPHFPGWWRVMANDGAGVFELIGDVATPPLPPPQNIAAADLDGDGLPDLVAVGDGYVATVRNLGGLVFGDPVVQYEDTDGPMARFLSLALGDLDDDGDLDLVVPAVASIGDAGPGLPLPHRDLLFRNEDGAFVLARTLSPEGVPGHAQAALFTDRDADGDLDLLIPSEFGMESEPTAFFRNDGPDGDWVGLTNDAPLLGADLRIAAMGIDAADLNGDGAMDYCISDFGPVQCLASQDGAYDEGAERWGIVAPAGIDDRDFAAWGVELVDLDADGFLDLVTAAGAPTAEDTRPQPDQLFMGSVDGFVDVGEEVGFADPDWHYGVASADFDGDGFRDLIIGDWDEPPSLWMNRCSAGGWLVVDLEGADMNGEGFGARVEVTSFRTQHVRELHNVRSFAQGPSELHFGFGTDTYASEVRVVWPDGEVQVAENVPLNRRLTFAR